MSDINLKLLQVPAYEGEDEYENACDDPDCWCRAQSEWPDNIKNGCEGAEHENE